MRIYLNIVVPFVCALLFSCSSSLKVTSDYDKKTDFAKYKTFAIDTSRISHHVSSPNVTRIYNALRSEMVKKGFTESGSSPDLRLSIAAIFRDPNSPSASADYDYGGIYRPWVWGGEGMGITAYSTYNVQNYRNGSLIINIADANNKALLWEGIGNTQVDKPLKDPDTLIPSVVSSIMAGFPPGKK